MYPGCGRSPASTYPTLLRTLIETALARGTGLALSGGPSAGRVPAASRPAVVRLSGPAAPSHDVGYGLHRAGASPSAR